MVIDDQRERCSRRKSAMVTQRIHYARLQECCDLLLSGIEAKDKTVELKNVRQWIGQISLEDKRLFIEAWNAWIDASAECKSIYCEGKEISQSTVNIDGIRILILSVAILAIVFWTDIEKLNAFSNAVLFPIGLASLIFALFRIHYSNPSSESVVRARLKARAVAWHVAGWQLHDTGEGFVGEMYPWKYDSVCLRLNAPRLKVKLSR